MRISFILLTFFAVMSLFGLSFADGPRSGSISGNLSYPSEDIPPLRVCAISIEDTKISVCVRTEMNCTTYWIKAIPAGKYYVVAYVDTASSPDFLPGAGGFTRAVPCGLTVHCEDHRLLAVDVSPGHETKGIDPGDWYAPEGAFPPEP